MGVSVDVPLVTTVLDGTEGMQMKRLWARDPRSSRLFSRYVVFFVSRESQADEGGQRAWRGEVMIFRGGIRGEGLVNMRGRDDLVARHIAAR